MLPKAYLHCALPSCLVCRSSCIRPRAVTCKTAASSCVTAPSKTHFVLFAASNNFTGSIPNVFPRNSSIELFHVDYNQLTGPLPSSLVNAVNLVDIDTTQNSLTGTIPSGLGSIASLQNFVVKMNNLSGESMTTLPGCRSLFLCLLAPCNLSPWSSREGLAIHSQSQLWHVRANLEQRTRFS